MKQFEQFAESAYYAYCKTFVDQSEKTEINTTVFFNDLSTLQKSAWIEVAKQITAEVVALNTPSRPISVITEEKEKTHSVCDSNDQSILKSWMVLSIKILLISHIILNSLLSLGLLVMMFTIGPSSIPWSHYGLWSLIFFNSCGLIYFDLKFKGQLPSQQEET